jgi:hypothetical protein
MTLLDVFLIALSVGNFLVALYAFVYNWIALLSGNKRSPILIIAPLFTFIGIALLQKTGFALSENLWIAGIIVLFLDAGSVPLFIRILSKRNSE